MPLTQQQYASYDMTWRYHLPIVMQTNLVSDFFLFFESTQKIEPKQFWLWNLSKRLVAKSKSLGTYFLPDSLNEVVKKDIWVARLPCKKAKFSLVLKDANITSSFKTGTKAVAQGAYRLHYNESSRDTQIL